MFDRRENNTPLFSQTLHTDPAPYWALLVSSPVEYVMIWLQAFYLLLWD